MTARKLTDVPYSQKTHSEVWDSLSVLAAAGGPEAKKQEGPRASSGVVLVFVEHWNIGLDLVNKDEPHPYVEYPIIGLFLLIALT